MYSEPIHVTLKISHRQALDLFGLLDSADEVNSLPSLAALRKTLEEIATAHYLRQQHG